IHASPFDFPAQCLFGIPTDLPEPRDDEPGHDAAVARVLVELAHASDGGMFVLFTSHGALRRAAEAVRGAIGGRWPLLVQGYGQLILGGLPPASRVVGSWQDVRRACEEFFAGHGIEAALGAQG